LKEIESIDGFKVIVDDEDYEYFNCLYDLYLNNHGYVYCKPKKKYKKMGLFNMTIHKILMNPEKLGRKVVVDHVDGNKLNNQKLNLRICTHAENMWNRKISSEFLGIPKTSKYKGVSYHKNYKCWRVQIKGQIMGDFDNEVAAANSYNYHAKILFGEFALLNDVEFMEESEWIKYKRSKNKSSQYIGVTKIKGKKNSRWLAQIMHLGKPIRIGVFEDEKDAAQAYNNKAIEIKGDKVKLNNICSH
jgi:hypothetical protein